MAGMRKLADCLQTRPVDYQKRMVKIRGRLSGDTMAEINEALKIIFSL
jgi:mRNA interferase MazF